MKQLIKVRGINNMDLIQILDEFKTHKKNSDITFKLLREIFRLEQDRIQNLPKPSAGSGLYPEPHVLYC